MRSLRLGVAGLLTGLLLALAMSRTGVSRPAGPEVLTSDVDGALGEIVLHYTPEFHEHVADTVEDLLMALPADVDVRVVVEDADTFELLQDEMIRRGVPRTREMTPVVTGIPVSAWSKDRFGTMVSDGQPVLAVPPVRRAAGTARSNDELVPELLCRQLDGVRCTTLPFMFEGGDLLADDEFVFISANFVARSQPGDEGERRALIERIGEATGRTPVPLGAESSDVPDHHIGMLVTPLGNGRVAVADPDLGRAIYRQFSDDRIDVETDDARYEPFRLVRRQVAAAGFDVVRVPMLLTTTPRVYVTYNNALVETRDGARRIYMPTYDVPVLDQMAQRIFEEQGLAVHPIRVADVYGFTGSLRCLVGVVRRY